MQAFAVRSVLDQSSFLSLTNSLCRIQPWQKCQQSFGFHSIFHGLLLPRPSWSPHASSSHSAPKAHRSIAPRICSSSARDLATGVGSKEHDQWTHRGGIVHKLATVDPSAIVEPGAVVHVQARVGPHAHIGSGSVVGPHVIVGSSTTLGYNVSLQNCSVGDYCIIHNGVCIGQDGFGFFVDGTGQMVKKPQTLGVQIGNYVEIGANTCIDRGSWRDTVVGDHTKIDNQVQIGHNVVIGQCCMLCGQVGLGGSSSLGDYVVIGGKAGVADHVSIVSKVRIAAMSGVSRNITEAGDYAGFPAVRAQEWRKAVIALRKFAKQSISDYLPLVGTTDEGKL